MIKKAYNITGFDCANCARKTEEHLNNHKLIQSARIDFAGNRLYLSFKENELTIDEILNIIKEVETDDISLTSIDVKVGKRKIFTKDLWILLGRVLFGVLAIIVCYAFFNTEDYYWVRFGVYLFSLLVMTYDIIYKVFNKIIHFKNPIDEYLLITISAYGAFAV